LPSQQHRLGNNAELFSRKISNPNITPEHFTNIYEGRRIGLEIVSGSYAQTACGVFDNFWKQAKLERR
jgi:hypothetical protein